MQDATQTASESDSEETLQSKATRIKQASWFQLCVALAIGLSTVSMALETDFEEWGCWVLVNAVFLLFFNFEITLRLVAERGMFFSCSNPDISWNMFDFSIVMVSDLDFIGNLLATGNGLMKYLLVLRNFRILRILRVLRLFKSFTQLSMLVAGLLQSFRSVMWIGVMIFMVMLAFAIFIRDQLGETDPEASSNLKDVDFGENQEEVDEYWGSVTRCLVTLFQFLTFDDWSMIAAMITDEPGMEYMIWAFWLYMFVAAFAMLGLLTGVVTDHMNEVSQIQKKESSTERDEDLEEFVREFRRSLEDVSNIILREDFKVLVNSESRFGRKLAQLGVSVNASDADDIFESLDRNRDGEISWEELSSGLKRMRGELQAKDILRIRFAAERVSALLGAGDEAATMQKLREVNDVMNDVDVGLRKLQKQLQGFIQDRNSGLEGLTSIVRSATGLGRGLST